MDTLIERQESGINFFFLINSLMHSDYTETCTGAWWGFLSLSAAFVFGVPRNNYVARRSSFLNLDHMDATLTFAFILCSSCHVMIRVAQLTLYNEVSSLEYVNQLLRYDYMHKRPRRRILLGTLVEKISSSFSLEMSLGIIGLQRFT